MSIATRVRSASKRLPEFARNRLPGYCLDDAALYERRIGTEKHEACAEHANDFTQRVIDFLKANQMDVTDRLKLDRYQAHVLTGLVGASSYQWADCGHQYRPKPQLVIAGIAQHAPYILKGPKDLAEISKGVVRPEMMPKAPAHIVTYWNPVHDRVSHSLMASNSPLPCPEIYFAAFNERPTLEDVRRMRTEDGIDAGDVVVMHDRIVIERSSKKGFTTTKFTERYFALGELSNGPFRFLYGWNTQNSDYRIGGLEGLPGFHEVFSTH